MKIQNSFQTGEFGKLYLVPTPIGNLEDMTFRAIRILKEVDIILAEDTRNSIKLLHCFDIHTPMQSYHQHSRDSQTKEIIENLLQGKNIALISDAGMPLINDPGSDLVKQAHAESIPVVPLPGPNAALTALVASALPSEQFTYYGFFPRGSKERGATLQSVGQRSETAIFYESPYRIKDAVEAVAKYLGPEVEIVIARELTKCYEQFIRGQAIEMVAYLKDESLKGECVLLIEGGSLSQVLSENQAHLPYKDHVQELMALKGLTAKEAIKEVAKIRKVRKQEVYNAYHDIN